MSDRPFAMLNDSTEGERKSAIILGILTKENGQEVFKHLTESEKMSLSKAIANLQVETFEEVEESVGEFVSIIKGNPSGLVESGVERVIELLEGIVSDEEKEAIIKGLFDQKSNLFASLSMIKDVNPLATMVANEEPQMIALIATFMKPEMAADLLAYLPTEKMTEVAEGIATMGQANPVVLERMEARLSEKIQNFNFSDASLETNGIKNIVSVLNNVPRTIERKLFENMEKTNPELAAKIKENLFVFEDIVALDARSLQKAFAVITDTNMIAKAMKTASLEVQEKVISAIPKQRRDILNEELDGMGPIQRVDSEDAQQEIANMIKELERNKEIVIDRGGGDVIL